MMYCLRSFIILLFLPFPLAPPLLTFLFFVAFYLRKRPCVYCTILLIALFSATCHWDLTPYSIIQRYLLGAPSSSSTSPASDLAHDVSNFTAAAFAPAYDRISRCWCDFNGGHLLSFRTFDVPRLLNVTASMPAAASEAPAVEADLALNSSSPLTAASAALQSAVAVAARATRNKIYTSHPLHASIINSGGSINPTSFLFRANSAIESFSSRFLQRTTGFKLTV